MAAPRHRKLPLLSLLPVAVLSLSAGSCPPNGDPVIRARDTFVLAYADQGELIRVRTSDDGYHWVDGGSDLVARSDLGPGLAVSRDDVGATRVLAYASSAGGMLNLRFGLGHVFDDQDIHATPNVLAHGSPRMATVAPGHYLITTLGGTSNTSAVIRTYDSSSRDFGVLTPAAIPGLDNTGLWNPPAVVQHGSRTLLAWTRYGPGPAGAPVALQLVTGDADPDGWPAWSEASDFSVVEPGYGDPVSEAALAADDQGFLLAVVRPSATGGAHRIFVYRSTDGHAWIPWSSPGDVSFTEGTRPALAARPGGDMVAMLIGPGITQVWRTYEGAWEGVRNANVFGSHAPSARSVALVAAGRRRSPIYVDDDNVDGPWRGTSAQPYHTITSAMAHARPGDRVVVRYGGYDESATLPLGVTLEGEDLAASPIITAQSPGPVLVASGNNTIRNVTLRSDPVGGVGVHVDIAGALAHTEGDGATAFLRVERSLIEGLNDGVRVDGTAPGFGGDRRSLRLDLRDNWLRDNAAGLRIVTSGPSAGALSIPLAVRGNVFQDNSSGAVLEMTGQGPNPGGFVRATISGTLEDNLIYGGINGVSMTAANLANVSPSLAFNTIADVSMHGIIATADPGANGNGRVSPVVTHNVIARCGDTGYMEFTPRAAAHVLDRNLFFQNAIHYSPDVGAPATTAAQLNGAAIGGAGNLVADPLFAADGFRWRSGFISYEGAGAFYLQHVPAPGSPAVNAGAMTAGQAGLDTRSTRTDLAPDGGPADLGFHYRTP